MHNKHLKKPLSFCLSPSLSLILSLILFLSILSLSLTTLTKNAEANMFNKFKKGFYFEKYKTAEEAKAALLELHPIGSDVSELVKKLEGAEASVIKESKVNLITTKNLESMISGGKREH